MAVAKKTFTLGVNDCKIYPISADTAETYTVGTGIDVPTVQSFTIEYEVDEKELFGDEQVRDMYSKMKKVNFSVDYGELDLDVQAAIMGGAVVSSGSGANQKQRYGYSLGSNDKYFQLAFKVDYTDDLGSEVADMHLHVMKCKINANSFNANSEEYGTLTFSGTGINTTNNLSAGKALYIDLAKTASELTAIVA